jgi:hypothetical protein
MHPLYADHPESKRLDQVDANIDKAEAAYRADPKLARDLEETGWCEHRYQAAREGRAVAWDGCRQQGPAIQFSPEPGKLLPRQTPWAGFTALRGEVHAERGRLVEQLRPQVMAALAAREAEIRAEVLDTPVGKLGALVEEASRLLATAVQVRGPVPATVPVHDPRSGRLVLAPPRFRESTDELELHEAAMDGWSLLRPLQPDEGPQSVITRQHGIHRDTDPSPTVADVKRAHAEFGAKVARANVLGR